MVQLSSSLVLLLTLQLSGGGNGWEKIRSIAETQHEIVMLLIKERGFDKILEAADQIFSLRFPDEQEHLFVEEGRILSDALAHQNQYDLAHQLLDRAILAVQKNSSQATLYKEKAYLCTRFGQDTCAMQFFQRALELEKSLP